MSNDIVPIGKYKGQPLERLMADQSYSDWLLAQQWFLERYADLAQLLRMGRLTEPQDTPEHNAMVAGLIDRRDEVEWLFTTAFPDRPREYWYLSAFEQIVEPKGGDLLFSLDRLQLLIEVKPLIGDDFPAVIRQIKAGTAGRGRGVVIARKVETTNLTIKQVRRQFELANVLLVMEDEFFGAAEPWRQQRHAHVCEAIPEIESELTEKRALVASKTYPLDTDKWRIAELEETLDALKHVERAERYR